jgi:hypothetical protein
MPSSVDENTHETVDASNVGFTNDNQPCPNVTARTEVLDSNENETDSEVVYTGTAEDDVTAPPDDEKKKLERAIGKHRGTHKRI